MIDQTVTDAATKRTAQVNAIRDFAVWLDRNPAMLVPELSLHRHMHQLDGTDAENLATVRSLAASLDVGTDESLDDRTVLRVKVNKHVYYELFAWHKGGRGDVGELERLRTEVAELRAAAGASLKPDMGAFGFSREPESTVAAPVPEHVEGHPEGRAAVVDETDSKPMPGCLPGCRRADDQYGKGSSVHADGCPEWAAAKARETEAPASGLTPAADQSRGKLAGTTPVVTYFSFGHGQTDPRDGKRLLDHYVTIVAPTYEECREAILASRFGRAWSFDYLAGTARATEWIPRWTEHEVIVAPGTDKALAEVALQAASGLLVGETAPPVGVLPIADGRVLHECCGKLDDAPHQNFCKHYEAPGLIVGDSCLGAPAGFETVCGTPAPHGPHPITS